jgi:D-apionolactonase
MSALRAGRVVLDGDGADLRALDAGGVVLVQRVYPGFRDVDWKTARPRVRRHELRQGARSFRLDVEGVARSGALDVAWRVLAAGTAAGELRYALELEARRAFAYRRIGVCVHLDAAAAVGARVTAGDARAELSEAIMPQRLRGGAPVSLVPAFTTLRVAHRDGSVTTLATGTTPFELEDQRNWADASFKAYSVTPAPLLRLERGELLRQEVRLWLEAPARRRRARAAARVRVGEALGRPVPPVGTVAASALAPAHVRVDVELGGSEPELPADVPIELAVHGGAGDPPVLPRACLQAPLARVLALERSEESTGPELLALVRAAVGASDGVPVAVGTSAHFSEVCRAPPATAGAQLLAWSACPQVHAGDDRSVMENLPALAAQVRTARTLTPGLRPLVSTLRLAPPGAAEARERSRFGAAWAVGALATLAPEDVEALTFSAAPAFAGPLAAAIAARGEPLLELERPADVAAVAWGDARQLTVLLANLTPRRRAVELALPGALRASVTALWPAGRRARALGRGELELAPYAALRIDARR